MRSPKNRILNALLLVLGIALVVVAMFRFGFFKVGEGNAESFRIEDASAIEVRDMSGSLLKLSDILNKDEVTHVLIFDSNDCPSCIYLGLEDLKHLRKEGRQAIALMIHGSLAEARSFASVNEVDQLMKLSKVTFYEKFQCALTPVMVKFKKSEVSSYRYIKP
jgi:hypothetical protein